VPLVPDEARHRDDHRETGDSAHDARHLWVRLQSSHQTAGQGGPRLRQLLLQGPLLHQAGLIPGNAVLNKTNLLKKYLFYIRYQY
jgi:hypothetical protein